MNASISTYTGSVASLIICSGGRGQSMSNATCQSNWTVQAFVATDYDQDIVWADGYFVRWPK